MNDIGLVSGLIAARMGQVQLAVAGKMLRMNADSAQAAAKLIEAGQQNLDRLANVAAGVGTNLDISA
jgi:hypothetical protein